jgi:hypothetical protein
LVEIPREKDHLGDQDINYRILKWILGSRVGECGFD